MAAKEQQIEEQWLVRVLEALNAFNRLVTGQKQNLDAEIEEFWKVYDPHDKGQNAEALYKAALLESLSLKTKLSALALKKPYFARVDFKEDGMSRPESIYLGKMAVYGSSEAPLPLVADWRAPVASLYYDGRLGEAAYDCPDGRVTGEISLKRQYIIENARLKEFFDIDITANDEFLQLALGSSKDKRLKDIVSTIQAEQNQIIRADMHGPVIVQGAAGSGKTTIALHRIAYLLYNYEKRLAPYNVLVVAPNRYFLSYISEVLPDLGVENVKQTTFEDFAFSFIEKRLKIKEGWEKLAYLLSNPPDAALVRRVSRIKSSLWFKKIIERYIEKLTLNLLPGRDFDLCGHVLMSKGEIRRLYCQDYAFLPILKRAVELRKYMQSSLKKRKPELLEDIEAYYEKEASRIKRRFLEGSAERREELTRLYNQRDGEIEILTKKSSGLISDYLKKIKPKTAYEYYRAFFEDADLFYGCTNGIIKPEDAQAVRDLSLKALEGGGCEAEDLAPIMLLHYALDGNAGFDIRHIVIDEAQDMSLFQIDMLKTLMNTGSFTILGDLCQGIYAFKGLSSWEDVSEKVFGGRGRFMPLERSYRTTVEIMDYASKTADLLKLNVPRAVPVIRHGPAVVHKECAAGKDQAAAIDGIIKAYQQNGRQSAAVICKTPDECQRLKKLLKSPGIRLLTGREKDYGGGTVILPAYLSKGLEFDGVVIADASRFGMTETDVKLLYVAMTRALHELSVVSVK